MPSINFEGRWGTKRSIGEGDLFAPLGQNDTTLLFGDARARFDADDNSEGNFGLGLRHMLSSGWNLGVYGYYDRRRTDLGNYFNQATFGVEALGRDFDFRANAYLPFGERAKDIGSDPGGETFANIVGTSIRVTTLGAVTREERALRGFDAEVGWRVPIWSVDDTKALRLYAGMFRFDDGVVEAITGPRLRAELTLYEVPHLWEGTRLTLDAEFENDDVRGSQGFAMARLSIPLQPAGSAPKLNWQERRMTERVVRDVDVVTETRTEQAPSTVETATQTSNGQAITLINSGTTSGAALPGAVAAAGANSLVILSGTFGTTATTTLQTGQTLMGAGSLSVETASGRTATLFTPGATINNTSTGTAVPIEMANNSTLSGMTVNAAGMNGVLAVDAIGRTGLSITNNTISASGTNNSVNAISLVNSSATVSGNNLSAVSEPGFYATGLFTNTGTYTVSNNTFNASGGDVTRALNLQNGATFTPGSTGNTLASGGCFANGANTGTIAMTGTVTHCP